MLPGALADDMDLTLSTPAVRLAQEEAVKARKLDGDNLVTISTGVAFGPDGTAFAAPVYVVVPYDARVVAGLGVPEMELKLYWWNPDKQDWMWSPGRVDPVAHTVNARVTRLAHFMVVVRKDDLPRREQPSPKEEATHDGEPPHEDQAATKAPPPHDDAQAAKGEPGHKQ